MDSFVSSGSQPGLQADHGPGVGTTSVRFGDDRFSVRVIGGEFARFLSHPHRVESLCPSPWHMVEQ